MLVGMVPFLLASLFIMWDPLVRERPHQLDGFKGR